MIPAGRYIAKPIPIETGDGHTVMAQFGETKAGAPKLLMHFQVSSGEFSGEVMPWEGYFSTDKTTAGVIKALRTLGFKDDDLSLLPAATLTKAVSVTVVDDEYNGEKRTKLKWIDEASAFKLKTTMSPDQLKKWADAMRPKMASPAESNGIDPDDKLAF